MKGGTRSFSGSPRLSILAFSAPFCLNCEPSSDIARRATQTSWRLAEQPTAVRGILKKICGIKVEDDGLTFDTAFPDFS